MEGIRNMGTDFMLCLSEVLAANLVLYRVCAETCLFILPFLLPGLESFRKCNGHMAGATSK